MGYIKVEILYEGPELNICDVLSDILDEVWNSVGITDSTGSTVEQNKHFQGEFFYIEDKNATVEFEINHNPEATNFIEGGD